MIFICEMRDHDGLFALIFIFEAIQFRPREKALKLDEKGRYHDSEAIHMN